MTWEELRSARRHGRLLKKVGDGIQSVERPPVLRFRAHSGVRAFPVAGVVLDEVVTPIRDNLWSPSPDRVHVPDLDDEDGQAFMDVGSLAEPVFERDVSFENLSLYWYEDHPDDRPVVWSSTPAGYLPPLSPDIPPSSFNVFVAWDPSE